MPLPSVKDSFDEVFTEIPMGDIFLMLINEYSLVLWGLVFTILFLPTLISVFRGGEDSTEVFIENWKVALFCIPPLGLFLGPPMWIRLYNNTIKRSDLGKG